MWCFFMLCWLHFTSLDWVVIGWHTLVIFWFLGLMLNTATILSSISHKNLYPALLSLSEPFNMYWRLFHCPVSSFHFALPQESFKKNYTSISPICIGYNSAIDFSSPFPHLLCIEMHSVDPDANVSSAVVRRAMCSPPDPERWLPGDHSRTAKGPALPGNYQLFWQGQGERYRHAYDTLTHMED